MAYVSILKQNSKALKGCWCNGTSRFTALALFPCSLHSVPVWHWTVCKQKVDYNREQTCTHMQWIITRSSAELMGIIVASCCWSSLSVPRERSVRSENNNCAHTYPYIPVPCHISQGVCHINQLYYSDTHVSDPSCTVDQNSSNVSVPSSLSAVHI